MIEPGNRDMFADYLGVSTAHLSSLLSEFGLHLVTDADKRVLDAMSVALIARDEEEDRPMFASLEEQRSACEAELARRGDKA